MTRRPNRFAEAGRAFGKLGAAAALAGVGVAALNAAFKAMADAEDEAMREAAMVEAVGWHRYSQEAGRDRCQHCWLPEDHRVHQEAP